MCGSKGAGGQSKRVEREEDVKGRRGEKGG